MSNTTTTATVYRIKADYGYFSNTLRAPKNGYVMGLPTYDSFTGREFQAPLDFDTIEDAHNYISAIRAFAASRHQ